MKCYEHPKSTFQVPSATGWIHAESKRWKEIGFDRESDYWTPGGKISSPIWLHEHGTCRGKSISHCIATRAARQHDATVLKRLSGRSCWLIWSFSLRKITERIICEDLLLNRYIMIYIIYIAEYDLGTCAFETSQPILCGYNRMASDASTFTQGTRSSSLRNWFMSFTSTNDPGWSNFPSASQYLCATGAAPAQGSQYPALRSQVLNQEKASCHHKIPQMKHSCLKPAPCNSLSQLC